MSSFFSGKSLLRLLVACAALTLMSVGGAGVASAASKGNPFPKLKGNWKCLRGGCWMRPIGGARERVACRVKYKVGGGGKTLAQRINCRGSIRMNANANVRMRKRSRLSGSWTSYNNHSGRVKGGASGNATSNKVFVGISGTKGFRGAMRAVINGKRHRVTLFQTKNGKRYVVGRLSLRR